MFSTRRCSRLRFHTLSERADGVNVFSVEVVYMMRGFGGGGGFPPTCFMPPPPSLGPKLLFFWGGISCFSAAFFVRTQDSMQGERSSSDSISSYSHRCEQARSVFTAFLQQIMCLLN